MGLWENSSVMTTPNVSTCVSYVQPKFNHSGVCLLPTRLERSQKHHFGVTLCTACGGRVKSTKVLWAVFLIHSSLSVFTQLHSLVDSGESLRSPEVLVNRNDWVITPRLKGWTHSSNKISFTFFIVLHLLLNLIEWHSSGGTRYNYGSIAMCLRGQVAW